VFALLLIFCIVSRQTIPDHSLPSLFTSTNSNYWRNHIGAVWCEINLPKSRNSFVASKHPSGKACKAITDDVVGSAGL